MRKREVSRLTALVQVDRVPFLKMKNTGGEACWGVGSSQIQFWTCQVALRCFNIFTWKR